MADRSQNRAAHAMSRKGKSRQQIADKKKQAERLLRSFAANAIVAYTDGACHGNNRQRMSPCGAGAAVYFSDSKRWREEYTALGSGTNSIGELHGFVLALTILDEEEKARPETVNGIPVEILTDSKYCDGVLNRNFNAVANLELVHAARRQLAARRRTNPVRVHWVQAHSGIDGNERADRLATKGANESSQARTKPFDRQQFFGPLKLPVTTPSSSVEDEVPERKLISYGI